MPLATTRRRRHAQADDAAREVDDSVCKPAEDAGGGGVVPTPREHECATLLRRQQALVELHSRLGIPEDVHGEELIVLVADRTRLPAGDLRRALGGPLPRTDDELVDLARRTAALRRALHRVDANRPPTDDLVPNRSPDRE